jgi:hypothetical protein
LKAWTAVIGMLLVVVLATPVATAQTPCAGGTACSGNGDYRYFLDYATWPYLSEVSLRDQTVGGTWTPLMEGCLNFNLQDLRARNPFHVFARSSVKIYNVQGVPSGGRFELRLVLDGQQISGAAGAFNIDKTGAYRMPQTEVIGGVKTGLATGNHSLRLEARTIDGGTFKVNEVLMNAQGTPTAYPAGSGQYDYASTLLPTGYWSIITPTLTVTNATGAPVKLLPQMYMQINAGTANARVPMKFELHDANTNIIETSPTIHDYIPCQTSSNGQCTYPAGATNSFTAFGRPMTVPPGTYYLRGLTRAETSSMTVAYRYLAFITVPPQTASGSAYANAENGALSTTPLNVTTTGSTDQPKHWLNGGGCKWTKVLEFQMPASAALLENWFGEMYFDFLRTGTTGWTDQAIDVTMEVETNEPGGVLYQEFGIWHHTVPEGPSSLTVPTDAMYWGNPAPGNKIRVFVRKSSCTQYAEFSVLTRYADLKKVPAAPATCYVAP